MKCEILCPACAKDARKAFPVESPFPGEHVKFLPGAALKAFRCDHCDAAIEPGDPCSAFTIWTDQQGFASWEGEYVRPDQPDPPPAASSLDRFGMDPDGVDWA